MERCDGRGPSVSRPPRVKANAAYFYVHWTGAGDSVQGFRWPLKRTTTLTFEQNHFVEDLLLWNSNDIQNIR